VRKKGKFAAFLGLVFCSFSLALGGLFGLKMSSGAIESRAADTTTYTFNSKSWGATSGGSTANWTSGKDGNQLDANQGVQTTEKTSGANATSPISFTNVSQIVVTYSTNASKGAGSIAFQVGSNTAKSQNVTTTGGTTDRALTYTFSPVETGNVKITVTCTKNSIYVKSVTVTTSTSYSYSVTATNGSASPNSGSISSSGSQNIVLTASSGYRVPDSSSITVTNATKSLSKGDDPASSGTLTISNPTGVVAVTIAFIRYYTISKTITYGSASGPTFIDADSSASITLSANAGYSLPTSVSVTGAASSYNSSTGVISLSEPTGAVSISATMQENVFPIETTVNHGTLCTTGEYESDTETVTNGTPIIFFEHATGYDFPTESGITVTNAVIGDYDTESYAEDNVAAIMLGEVIGPVSVTISCTAHWYNITKNVTGGSATGASTIVFGGNATVNLASNEGYKLPASITVSGASYEYDSATGSIALSNPTADVTITVAMTALTPYSITVDIPEESADIAKPAIIYSERSASITVIPLDGYALGNNPTVTNATKVSWDMETGVLEIANPTGNVTVSGVVRAMYVYEINVTVTGGTGAKSQETIREDQSATVTFTPNEGYKLPSDVTVTNASKSYNATTGVVTLSNPTGVVGVVAEMVALTKYTITVTEENATHTGATYIYSERTASITFTADANCFLPSMVTVTGAETTWNKATGVLTLSNPTSNVTVTVLAIVKALDHIDITTNPTKTSYTIGDELNVTGMVVKAYDNDDTSRTISNNDPELSLTGYDKYTVGEQTVTANYRGKTDTFSITVSAIAEYVKVTSADELTADGHYLIVCEASSKVMTTAAAKDNQDDVTISDDKITGTPTLADYEFTLVENDGSFAIKGPNDQYIYQTGDSNGLRVSSTITDDCYHTIAFSAGNADIVSPNEPHLRYNSTENWFRFYKSATYTAQKAIQIYKRSASSALIGITAELADPEKVYVEDGTVPKNDFHVQTVDGGGTKVDTSDFVVASHTLAEGNNKITITYAPDGVPGSLTATVNVVAIGHGDATVTQVTLVQGSGTIRDYYWAEGVTAWDPTGLTVQRKWDDSRFDDEVSLSSLIESGDATLSPTAPAENSTSFTVNYTYSGVAIDNNVVSITMHEDTSTSVHWANSGVVDSLVGSTIASALNTTEWEFVVSWCSGKDATTLDADDVGTGSDDVHIGLYDTNNPAAEGTPLSLDYAFTDADNGKYLVAYYLGVHSLVEDNHAVFLTSRLNSITVPGTTEPGYVRVSDASEIQSGDKVVIAEFTDSETIYVMDTYSSGDFVSAITDSQSLNGPRHLLSSPDPSTVYTVETGVVANSLSFKDSTDKYIYAVSSSKNWMRAKDDKDKDGSFSLSMEENGLTFLTAQGDNTRNSIRYNYNNGTSPRFSCYGDNTNVPGVAIYKYYAAIPSIELANTDLKAQKAVIAFADYFNDQMNDADVCGINETAGINVNYNSSAFTTAWSNVATKFTQLFVTENTGDDADTYGTYKLTETEVQRALWMLQYGYATWEDDTRGVTPVARDTLQRALKTYDHVVTHSDLTAFMSEIRTPSLALNVFGNHSRPSESPLTMTLWIVLGSGLAGLVAIGSAYWISKKRRANA